MVVNFYQGPYPLTKLEEVILRQSGENDCHLVVYKENVFQNDEEIKKLKKFRLFNTKNVFKSIHLKYWVCDDAAIAKKLGITTQGDLYLLRQTHTPYSDKPANVSICDYPFTVEKIANSERMNSHPDETYAKIFSYVLDAPIIVHDFMEFAQVQRFFDSVNFMVVYCNPQQHGYETYDKVLRSMIKSRRMKPINHKPSVEASAPKETRDQDVLYILCTEPNFNQLKLSEKHPQAVFMRPDK